MCEIWEVKRVYFLELAYILLYPDQNGLVTFGISSEAGYSQILFFKWLLFPFLNFCFESLWKQKINILNIVLPIESFI